MRLMFIGDISPGEHFFSFGHGPRSVLEKGGDIFEGVEGLLSKADFVVGNLEGCLSNIGYGSQDPLSRVFRGHPAIIAQFQKCKINILNVANNHSLQHGRECFSDTLKKLEEAGLHVIGRAEQLDVGNALVIGNDKIKIGILAASDIPDNTYPNQEVYARFNMEEMNKAVSALKKKCEHVIVVLHWGVEGRVCPSESQESIAKQLVKNGAELIIGHHPHVFYRIERMENGLVAYSLGNFLFDMPWDRRFRISGILDVEIEKKGSPMSAVVWPVKINSEGLPTVTEYPIPIRENGERFDRQAFSEYLRNQILKKSFYFLFFLPKGATLVKLRFLWWKLKNFTQRRK